MPKALVIISRYRRRRAVARLYVRYLFPSFVALLAYLDLVKYNARFARFSRSYLLSEGNLGVLILTVFFAGLVAVFYRISCPVCKFTFFTGEKTGGLNDPTEVEGYCASCKQRFEIAKYMAEARREAESEQRAGVNR